MQIYPNNPLMMGQANFSPYLTNLTVPNYQPVMPNSIPNQAPSMQINCVNGKESAYSFQMGPNSSTILVDNNQPIIYLVTTDSAGYKAVKAYQIVDIEENTESTSQNLEERIKNLEERLNAYEQSDTKSSHKNQSSNAISQPNDRNGQGGKGPNGNYSANGTK